MPLIATRGAASVQGFGEFAQTAAPVYIEDVFSTYLYTGNGSSQTITNGIDLSTKGGLVWAKCRTLAASHRLTDTVRGAGNSLISNSTLENQTAIGNGAVTSFASSGYITDLSGFNSTDTHASWTFREQPKFFDVVTYTGNGAASRNIAHNLGSVPGCIICKVTSTTGFWGVYHRSTGANGLYLNATNSAGVTLVPTGHTSTTFEVADGYGLDNVNGATYVAYLFAHDAGGFGATGSDNVISCGSWTGNTSVNLGYEPQWILIKKTDSTSNWFLLDVMRGWTAGGILNFLLPNSSAAESTSALSYLTINSTGFAPGSDPFFQTGTFIYIAIRRGPMKTPTTGTSVYNAITRTGTGTAQTITSIGFPPDLLDNQATAVSTFTGFFDRLRGGGNLLYRALSDPETTVTGQTTQFNTTMSGFAVGASTSGNSGNNNGVSYVWHAFRRAPGFFDEVCYTGTGSNTTVTHNLGVAPELVILKRRNSAEDWPVLQANIPTQATLNGTFSGDPPNSSYFGNGTSYVAPTSTVFSVGTNSAVNASGGTYVAYLFASCPGVSKVGSYTGTGATQTISCGFAARFVLIKRTDSVGNWWVWDTARGMVTGTDPRLAWDTTNSQFNNDWVFTDASGFQIVTTDATVNASGGTYIFLAIA